MNHPTENSGSTRLHLAVNNYGESWLLEAFSQHTRDDSDYDDGDG